MNKENILLLADMLENEKPPQGIDYFNMRNFYRAESTCGTAGCIAGWAAALNGWKLNGIYNHVEEKRLIESACKFLGLEKDVSALFAPVPVIHSKITPQIAASVLRNLAETGEVDWTGYDVIRRQYLDEFDDQDDD